MASVSWEAYGGARQTHRRLMNVPQGSPLIDTVDGNTRAEYLLG